MVTVRDDLFLLRIRSGEEKMGNENELLLLYVLMSRVVCLLPSCFCFIYGL